MSDGLDHWEDEWSDAEKVRRILSNAGPGHIDESGKWVVDYVDDPDCAKDR
jgi:hypothetical protein